MEAKQAATFVVYLGAPNDGNGNPRRVYVVYDDQGLPLAALDEGYAGRSILRNSGYDNVPVSDRIDVTASEYRFWMSWKKERGTA